ncbi:Uu.00g003770.m01.CDS01 [Anthostomella pinea]|uniref:Uu.00g003770.m01.CDS01 n=1 Tax=Anthostomella pinea TaxID=933095 RepID=A0AAI8VKF5_9PEZI|nr:Uu.00g003770.m01.CDS01 [Anthostomella pinea]
MSVHPYGCGHADPNSTTSSTSSQVDTESLCPDCQAISNRLKAIFIQQEDGCLPQTEIDRVYDEILDTCFGQDDAAEADPAQEQCEPNQAKILAAAQAFAFKLEESDEAWLHGIADLRAFKTLSTALVDQYMLRRRKAEGWSRPFSSFTSDTSTPSYQKINETGVTF